MSSNVLEQLARTIHERRNDSVAKSYTRQLLDGGPERCAKKLGEEAVETVIALMAQDDTALRGEAADLIYHLLVALECRDVAIADVLEVLRQRMGLSGLEEKASRQVGDQSPGTGSGDEPVSSRTAPRERKA